MIVVPGTNSGYDFVALIANGAEYRIYQRPSTGSNKNFVGCVRKFLAFEYKCCNRFTKIKIALCSRVVGKMISVRGNDFFFQFLRDRKNGRIEVAYCKVVNFFSLSYFLSDVAAELYDF